MGQRLLPRGRLGSLAWSDAAALAVAEDPRWSLEAAALNLSSWGGMDGREVTRRFRTHRPRLPVTVVTRMATGVPSLAGDALTPFVGQPTEACLGPLDRCPNRHERTTGTSPCLRWRGPLGVRAVKGCGASRTWSGAKCLTLLVGALGLEPRTR